jgi:ribonuclease HI
MVVLVRCKLRHYFEAHLITVVSSFRLGEILCNPDAVGRIAKWSVELMGETLAYAPRKAIKSQILADFVAEWTDTQLPLPQIWAECWTLYFNGSVMKTGVGVGLLFISPLGEHMRYAVRLHFPASNNMAEYEALLCGLRIAIETGIKRLDVRGDSQLVIDRVMNVIEPLKLIPYYCLNHSSWPLSSNIEVTCRLCRVKPSKSLTSQDRQLYIKTHMKASPQIKKSQIIT